MESKTIEVGVISNNNTILNKIKSVCEEFEYTFESWPNLETFIDKEPDCMVVITVVSEYNGETKENAAECCQAAKGTCNDAFVVCVVDKMLKKEHLPFLKKSGANLILLEEEIHSTSKLEFLLTQELKARFFPIKTSDLVQDTEINFNLYHLVTHRAKFLPCAFDGSIITESKLNKLKEISEIYVNRHEVDSFKKYVDKHAGGSANGMASRCRARFINLCAGYTNLVFLLTDQGEHSSFDKGTMLLNRCKELCNELMAVVAEFENVWDIVDNSAIGNMGSVERATAIATYVAVFGMSINMNDVDNIMVATLLSDIGLLFIPPDVLKKIRKGYKITEEERLKYEQHPLASVSLALERKLQMTNEFRKIIEMTHERQDGKGFPRQPLSERIPIESQLIQFCQEFDSRTLFRLGELKVNAADERKKMILEEMKTVDKYTPIFITKLKKVFVDNRSA